MAANKLHIPVEVTTATIKAALDGGRSVLRYGENLAQRVRPGYIAPQVLARQAILKRFEHNFGVAGDLLDPTSSEVELQERASLTAKAMVERKLIDKSIAVVELRPVLTEDALSNPVMNSRRELASNMLRDTLSQEYGVDAILNSHPIMPVEHDDSPIDASQTWGAVATELDGMLHQIGDSGNPQAHLAMLGITSPFYMKKFFGPQIISGSDGPVPDSFLILENVGVIPEQNLLGRRSSDRSFASGA